MSIIYNGITLTGDEKDRQAMAKEMSIEEIQKKLDEISSRLERVEKLIVRLQPGIEEVNESAKVIREGFDFYDGIVKLMTKFTRAERLQSRYGELQKDEISWKIVQVLDGSRPLNISQITAAVRAQRGTASRRIIRERLKQLVEQGIVSVIDDEDSRIRYYTLSQ